MKSAIQRKPLTPAEEAAIHERITFTCVTDAHFRAAEIALKCARKRWRELPGYAHEQIAEANRHIAIANERVTTSADSGAGSEKPAAHVFPSDPGAGGVVVNPKPLTEHQQKLI